MIEIFSIGSISWFISTMVGGGGAMIFVPLAGLILPIITIAPIVSIAGALSGSQRIYLYKDSIDWKITKLVAPGLVFGAIFGASFYAYVNHEVLALLLAVFYLAAGGWSLFRRNSIFFKIKKWHFPLAGFISSFVSGVVGTGGPFMNPLYLNYGLNKEALIGTKASTLMIMQIIKIITYSIAGLYSKEIVIYGLVASVGAGDGNYFGRKYLRSLSADTFKVFVNIMLIICAFIILYKSV